MSEQIRIIYPTSRSDFALHYDSQVNAQPGGIEIDPEEKTLGVFCWGEIGHCQPMDVYHRRRRWYPIHDPEHTTVGAMRVLLDEIAPLAQRVCDGYDCDWDGNNMVGTLDDDALAAHAEIERITEEFFDDSYDTLEEESDDDEEEEEDVYDSPYIIETGDGTLGFDTLEDARFYYFNHYTKGERKHIDKINRYTPDFDEISAEYELIINDVGVKFNTYEEARERYFSLSEEERAKVDEDTYHEGNPFYEKLAKENN